MISSPYAPVPPFLYKYRPVHGPDDQYTRDIIVGNRLWFSAAKAFNDPFDSFPYFSLESTDEQYETYLSRIVNQCMPDAQPAERLDALNLMRSQSRDDIAAAMQGANAPHLEHLAVCCLSAACDQILMWSHYANAHSGICLRFSTRPYTQDILDAAYPVNYAQERAVVNRVTSTSDHEAVFQAMLVKADFWAYEQEYRLFRPHLLSGSGHESFMPDRLDGVIFGARCSPEDRALVKGWVEERGGGVELLEAIPDKRQFRLSVRSLRA